MENSFQKNNFNKSFPGFQKSEHTKRKSSILNNNPYASPSQMPSTPPTALCRAQPSLDLRKLSPSVRVHKELFVKSTESDSHSYAQNSSELTSSSGHATDIARHTSCELSSINSAVEHTLPNQFDMFEPPTDSGIFPFSTDSIANSTTIEDDMWPEYCIPVPVPVPPPPPIDVLEPVVTIDETEKIPCHVIQKQRQSLPTWMPMPDQNRVPCQTQHRRNTMQFNQRSHQQLHPNCVIDDQVKTCPVKPNYIFVDQIDEWQKELMIRASPCMQSFFYEIASEPTECPFRRIMFHGLSREQFLILIRYLQFGKSILKYLRPEELQIYKRVAFLHGFHQLGVDCDLVFMEQQQYFIQMELQRMGLLNKTNEDAHESKDEQSVEEKEKEDSMEKHKSKEKHGINQCVI